MDLRYSGLLALMMGFVASCGEGYADRRGTAGFGHDGALLTAGADHSDCAQFCNELPPGPQRGRCVSDAAHGEGLCAQCGGNVGLLCGRGQIDQQSGQNSDPQPFCCAPGQTCCGDAACADLQSDRLNCGACGNACPSGFCGSGACCATGTTAVCNGQCVNTTTDVNNCGACGNTCPSGFCGSGACCPAGTTAVCNGQCVNTTTDVNNCGTCGTSCGPGGQCTGGSCCAPTTCAAQGKNCGTIADACGGTLDCGTCTGTDTCGGGGTPNVCEPSNCSIVNGIRWCYDPNSCGDGCIDVCTKLGLPLTIDDATWLNAQNTVAKCQAINDAFGLGGSVSVSGFAYACIEDQLGMHTAPGGLIGPLICSDSAGCPSAHRLRMDQQGVPCGDGSRRSVCPCQ